MEVAERVDEIDGQVACVSFAEPGLLERFEGKLGLPYPIYGDPGRAGYRAFGFDGRAGGACGSIRASGGATRVCWPAGAAASVRMATCSSWAATPSSTRTAGLPGSTEAPDRRTGPPWTSS